MSQPSVTTSGASFTAPLPRSSSRTQLLPRPAGVSRTIIETALCPPELKRGSKGWSINDLKVQRVLGEGALSTVVHCLCAISGLPVALKLYHRDKLNALNVKQVGREIDIHASLIHQNVIKLYAAFEDADGIYLVQEFATGGDLYAELARHGGYMLEAHVIKNVMAPFLTAICHLHTKGILHRDIKPENILLTGQGEIKVADFGLAIDTIREKPMSRVGTLDYMPPEIAILPRAGAPMPLHPPGSPSHASRPHAASPHCTPKSPSPLGAATSIPNSPAPGTPTAPPPPPPSSSNYGLPVDVWCAGILAYELLVGGPPFEADTKEATYIRIIKTEPFIPGHLSAAAQDFIKSALRKDPALRPTIDQLAAHPWLRSAQRARAPVVAATVAVVETAGQALAPAASAADDNASLQASAVCVAYTAKTTSEEEAVDVTPKIQSYSITNTAETTLLKHTSKPSSVPMLAILQDRIPSSLSLGTPTTKSSVQKSNFAPPLQHNSEKLAEKPAVTARSSSNVPREDLIAAAYGDNVREGTAASPLIQALVHSPFAGSTKSRKPRILSSYLKKLSISALIGIGSNGAEKIGKGGEAAAVGAPSSRLATGGAS